ncbi:MAG: division/cell wall cluster transcriptional repressor MraZ [Christensenellaceae bacterium]
MFYGKQKHKADAKNRIRIPAQYKEELGKRYVLTKGALPEVVYVYPESTFLKRVEKVAGGLNSFRPHDETLFNEFMAGVFDCEEDNQGRLLLKEDIREYANIKKDVVTVGVYDHLEIVSLENYEKRKNQRSFAQVMEEIADICDKAVLQNKND